MLGMKILSIWLTLINYRGWMRLRWKRKFKNPRCELCLCRRPGNFQALCQDWSPGSSWGHFSRCAQSLFLVYFGCHNKGSCNMDFLNIISWNHQKSPFLKLLCYSSPCWSCITATSSSSGSTWKMVWMAPPSPWTGATVLLSRPKDGGKDETSWNSSWNSSWN